MRLYHWTHRDTAASILRDGFRNSEAIPSLGIHAGVWLADVPTMKATGQGGADGQMLTIDVPARWAARYFIDGSPGEHASPPWREYCIPARLLNSRRAAIALHSTP
ncbi:MAG: hypothetical protein QOI73_861 [Solirubrobacteraceae bacterium]|nr:hypothetical protein [Solirubrobacteraceae bacterium]